MQLTSFISTKLAVLKKLNLLHIINQVFGISVPQLHNYKGIEIWYIIYVLIIIVMLSVFVGYCIFEVSEEITRNSLNILVTGYFTSAISFIMMCTILFKRRSIVRVVKSLTDLEKTIVEKKIKMSPNLNVQIIMLGCFVLTFIACDFIRRLNTIKQEKYFYMKYYTILFFQFYIIRLFSQISNIRYLILNLNLLLHEDVMLCAKSEGSDNVRYNSYEMSYFLKKYVALYDIIDLFGKTYGYQILGIISCIIVGLGHSFSVIICWPMNKYFEKVILIYEIAIYFVSELNYCNMTIIIIIFRFF